MNVSKIKFADREKIATRVRLAREMAGLSQAQVAKFIEIPRPSVTEIESGKRRVSADELTQLAKLFDVSVGWLVDENPESVDSSDPRIQLAARELNQMKPDDLDRLLKLISAIKSGS